jgi:hypothetical protein
MIKKVMMATINFDHPQMGMLQAFTSVFGKENVLDFDYVKISDRVGVDEANREFSDRAAYWQPDWIWLQLQMTKILKPSTITQVRARLPKTVVSHWMGDCRASVDPYLADACKVTHLTLVSNVGHLPMYFAAGAKRARYCQIGLDWDEDVMGLPGWTPPFRVPEVVLLGNHYGSAYPGTSQREEAIRVLIDAGIDVGVIGSGWPAWARTAGHCHVKQQYHVWSRAKVGLCVNNFNDVELHYSDRQIISMASGTPIVAYEVPGLRREFEDGEHCVMYRMPEQLVAGVRQLLGNEALRRRIGAAGRAKVMRDHTWWNRIFDVLPVVEEIQASLGG